MKESSLDRLIHILSLQAESKELERQKQIAYSVLQMYQDNCSEIIKIVHDNENNNFYITKGSPPKGSYYPCAVAHLDQVHYTKSWYKIFRDDDILFAMGKTKDGDYVQVGTGSDDLAGVWLALELLISQPFMKVAFFSDEEIGCIGSTKADMDFFSDCAFVMQGDRRHNKSDFIIHTNGTEVSSEDFQQSVKPLLDKYEYSTANGSCTDVGQLTLNGIGICTVNLSCGYLYPHTDYEVSSINLSFKCLGLMADMANTMCGKRWEFTPPPKPVYKSAYSKYSGGGWDWNDSYDGWNYDWGWTKSYDNKVKKSFDIDKDNFMLDYYAYYDPQMLDEVLYFMMAKGYKFQDNIELTDKAMDDTIFYSNYMLFEAKTKTAKILMLESYINYLKGTTHTIKLKDFSDKYLKIKGTYYS